MKQKISKKERLRQIQNQKESEEGVAFIITGLMVFAIIALIIWWLI